MGPPTISPRSLRVRYATDSVTSQYLITMPASALSHNQKIAPGPPVATASATPTMLPVPSVAASAVHTAWNGDMAPCSSSDLSGRWKSVLVV